MRYVNKPGLIGGVDPLSISAKDYLESSSLPPVDTWCLTSYWKAVTVQITQNLYASILHSRVINTRQSSTRVLEFECSYSRSRVTFEFECSSSNVGRSSIRRLYKHSYRASSYSCHGLYAARAHVVLTNGRLWFTTAAIIWHAVSNKNRRVLSRPGVDSGRHHSHSGRPE